MREEPILNVPFSSIRDGQAVVYRNEDRAVPGYIIRGPSVWPTSVVIKFEPQSAPFCYDKTYHRHILDRTYLIIEEDYAEL